jgi:hypothetical protein
VFWLVKDTCWMLEVKWLGALMIVPTISVAIYIIYKTRQSIEVWISCAVLAWITANSFWMLMEFFNHNQLKDLAAFPFALGFLFAGLYYLKSRDNKNVTQ